MNTSEEVGKESAEFPKAAKDGYVVLDIPESAVPTGGFHPNLRNAFLRRVYAILTTQVVITTLVSLACIYHPGIRGFCINYHTAVLWGTLVPSFCLLFWLSCIKGKYPLNLVVLYIFTFVQSLVVGAICAVYYHFGLGAVIAQAAALSVVMFIGLSAYALISKTNFSFLGGFLGGSLLILCVWGVINLIFGFHLQFVYSLCGTLLFCGFIVYDTYKVSEEYDVDHYVEACIDLYLNLVNLFLFLLQFLRSGNN